MEYGYGWVKWSLMLKQNTDEGLRFLIRFICKIFAMNTCNIWKSVTYHYWHSILTSANNTDYDSYRKDRKL